MIEQITEMPVGAVGLRASGKLSKEDYRGVLEPVLREAVESGELRLVFVLTDFHGLEPGAWIEDVKTGLRVWVRDHAAWKRFALVTERRLGRQSDAHVRLAHARRGDDLRPAQPAGGKGLGRGMTGTRRRFGLPGCL